MTELVLHVRVIEGRNLVAKDHSGKSDPYCVVKLKKNGSVYTPKSKIRKFLKIKGKAKTSLCRRTLHPVWIDDMSFFFDDYEDTYLSVNIFDWDLLGRDNFMGKLRIPMSEFQDQPRIHKWFELFDAKCLKSVRGQINIKMFVEEIDTASFALSQNKTLSRLLFEKKRTDQFAWSSPLEQGAEEEQIRLCMATWNVGNAPPPYNLEQWLSHTFRNDSQPPRHDSSDDEPDEIDIYVISSQECRYEPRRKPMKSPVKRMSSINTSMEVGRRGSIVKKTKSYRERIMEMQRNRDALSSEDYSSKVDQLKHNKESEKYKSTKDDWIGTLQAHLGPNYVLMADHHLLEIRMTMFVRKSQTAFVSNIERSKEATGIAHVIGNKGAVALSFEFRHTRLCVVGAHLAAHQHKVKQRNHQVKEIIRGTTELGSFPAFDITNKFHHLFWMGDLNYRIDFIEGQNQLLEKRKLLHLNVNLHELPEREREAVERSLKETTTKKTPSHDTFDAMLAYISKKWYHELYLCDQLQREMMAGRVFAGFEQGKINFPPTFKVARNPPSYQPQLQYNPERAPAWTDRILWKCGPGFEDKLEQCSLFSAENVCTSDHKPVAAHFQMNTFTLPSCYDPMRGPCMLRLSNLRANLVQPSKLHLEGAVESDADHHAQAQPIGSALQSNSDPAFPVAVNGSFPDLNSVDSVPMTPVASIDWEHININPFIKFSSPCLFQSVVTPIKHNTLSPVWTAEDNVPVLQLKYNRKERLDKMFIMVRVYHKPGHNAVKGNLLLGQGLISLAPLQHVPSLSDIETEHRTPTSQDRVPPKVIWQQVTFGFHVQLTRYGLPAGSINGAVLLIWDEATAPTTVKKNKQVNKEFAALLDNQTKQIEKEENISIRFETGECDGVYFRSKLELTQRQAKRLKRKASMRRRKSTIQELSPLHPTASMSAHEWAVAMAEADGQSLSRTSSIPGQLPQVRLRWPSIVDEEEKYAARAPEPSLGRRPSLRIITSDGEEIDAAQSAQLPLEPDTPDEKESKVHLSPSYSPATSDDEDAAYP